MEVRVLSAALFLLKYFMWLIFVLFFLFNSSPVKSQTQGELFTQYRNDYLFLRDEYQKNYLDFLNKNKETGHEHKIQYARRMVERGGEAPLLGVVDPTGDFVRPGDRGVE